jgi:hypothetical protein
MAKLILIHWSTSFSLFCNRIFDIVFIMVFRSLAFLALAVLPFSLAQVSNDFENGWDQAAWPTYAPDCSQVNTEQACS